jgi:uncharacterized protein
MSNKRIFWTLVNIFIVILIVLSFAITNMVIKMANSTVATRTIYMQGSGEVTTTPDIAEFNFSAIAQAETADLAEQEATKNLNKAIAFLKDNGISEKDIQTASFNIYPRYNYNKPRIGGYEGPEIIGYEANQSVSVKIRNLNSAGQIVGGVARNGASQVSGLNFTIDDIETYRNQARQEAFDDAWNKATTMAKQAGVRIARVVSFSEGGDYGYGGAYETRAFALDQAEEASLPSIPDIEPGQQKVRATVNVTYEIK